MLLVAEAGFGKTTALEEAMAGRTAVWLSCDARDADPVGLLGRLIAELARVAPGAAETHAAALDLQDPLATARALRDDLGGLLLEPLVVVFEDAERLADSKPACAAVGELMRGRAETVRVAVASRRELPLRLAKLRAAGRVTELGPADLAMSPDECAEVLHARRGRQPDDAEVEAVMEATRGWPLGVALAALSRPGALGFGAPSRLATFDFMAEEVLEGLEPELRDALLDASVPAELDASVVAALRLPPDLLGRAERLGFFLRPVDDEGRWFRFHPLFREFLLTRFDEERPDERRRELRSRAAEALAAAGRFADAVDHWLDAGEWTRAIDAMTRTRQAGLAPVRTSPETVIGWLDRLPAGERRRPEVLQLAGTIEWTRCRYASALEPLGLALDGYRAEGASEREWLARFLLADTLFELGRLEEAAEVGGAEIEHGPEGMGIPDARFLAATALAAMGRLEEAERLWERVDLGATTDVLAPLMPAFRGAFVDLARGDLDLALERTTGAAAALDEPDPVQLSAYAHWLAARVLEERGEDAEALAAARRADEAAQRGGVLGHLGSFLALHRPGSLLRAGLADEAEAELEGAVGGGAEGWRTHDLEVARACLAAARGRTADAVAAAERALALAAAAPVVERARAACLLAPVLAEAGQPARAREIVEQSLERAAEAGVSTARPRAVRAWLRALQGDAEGAFGDLAAALAEAGDQAHHLLRREWPHLERLVWDALEAERLEPSDTIRAIERAHPGGDALLPFTSHPLAAVRRSAAGPAAASGHPEALTRLEELERDADDAVAAAARGARAGALRSPPPLVIRMLGGFRVSRGSWGLPDTAWGRPMAARFVRFLLVNRSTAIPEDELFQAFWPELETASARRSLHVVATRARAVLDHPGRAESALDVRDRTYRLVLAPDDRVDVDEFEAAAAAALADTGPGRRRLLEHARGLWGGEPLPEDRYADWTIAWRERLVDRYGEVVEALAAEYASAGHAAAAVDAARILVELDPLNERAHRELMAAYARAGRTSHALRQFLACRRLLVDELGVEPGSETARLQRRILAGEPV